MALISPAWGIQGGSHDAKAVRQVLAASFGAPVQTFGGGIQPTDGGGAHGVIGDDDLKVTQTGTPGMKVNIAAGSAVVTGTSVLAEGALAFVNDADLEVTIAVGDASNARKDLVCIQKQENVLDASGQDRVRALVVAGTPSATPSDPAVPAGCLVLARVTVAANEATSIVNADIDDLRTYAAAFGGVQRCTSASRPTGASRYQGQQIYELDTGSEYVWTGSVWRPANLDQVVCVVQAPSQVASNAVYDLLFFSGTVESDPLGWINPGDASQFLPDVAGWYDIGCSVTIATSSTVTAAEMRKNGSLVRRQDNGAAFANPDFYIRDVVYLNGTTDYVTIESFQGSGSAQTHTGRIAARWIGP